MNTKFDIGEIVLVPARVERVEITAGGTSYQVSIKDISKPWLDEKSLVPAEEIKDDINTYVARK